jgi:hypothetical protein
VLLREQGEDRQIIADVHRSGRSRVGTTSRLAQSDGSNGYVVLSTGGIVFRVLCVRSDVVSRPVLVASALGNEEIGIVSVKGLGCRGAGKCSNVVYCVYDNTVEWHALGVENSVAEGFGECCVEKRGRAVCVGESAGASEGS